MSKERSYGADSAAVQAHLNIAQSVIQRMAANSAACKTWCITLVSAILVIVADKGKPHYALIGVIPTILFLVLDSYYLALEKMLRHSYNNFIEKLHTGEVSSSGSVRSGSEREHVHSDLRLCSVICDLAVLSNVICNDLDR